MLLALPLGHIHDETQPTPWAFIGPVQELRWLTVWNTPASAFGVGVCNGSFDLCDRCDHQGTSAKADYGFVAVTWAGAPLAKSGCYAIIRVWSAKYVKP